MIGWHDLDGTADGHTRHNPAGFESTCLALTLPAAPVVVIVVIIIVTVVIDVIAFVIIFITDLPFLARIYPSINAVATLACI